MPKFIVEDEDRLDDLLSDSEGGDRLPILVETSDLTISDKNISLRLEAEGGESNSKIVIEDSVLESVVIKDFESVIIRNCDIQVGDKGFNIKECSDVVVEDSKVQNSGGYINVGIELKDIDDFELNDVTVEGCVHGISIIDSQGVVNDVVTRDCSGGINPKNSSIVVNNFSPVNCDMPMVLVFINSVEYDINESPELSKQITKKVMEEL